MTRPRRIEKRLSYRLPLIPGQESERVARTAAHWANFQWQTGPVIVEWTSFATGVIQVWASSEEEGKRVIAHALADMNADPKDGSYAVFVAKNPRYGRRCLVVPSRVSLRNGPSGEETAMQIIPSEAILSQFDGM